MSQWDKTSMVIERKKHQQEAHTVIFVIFYITGCKSCFHKECFVPDKCPRCARLEAR